MKTLLSIVAFVLFSAASSLAADRYYDFTNGHDGNPCTEARPCKTLDKLHTDTVNAACGDRFFLKRGETWTADYSTDNIKFHDKVCTEGNQILVSAYGEGNRPILDGGNQKLELGGPGHGVFIRSSAFITIENIHLRNWLDGSMVRHGRDILFDNVEVGNVARDCWVIRRRAESTNGDHSERVTVQNSHCHHTHEGGTNGEGFYIGVDSSKLGTADPDGSGPIFILNNLIHDTTEGIEIKSGVTAIIEGNTIFNSECGSQNVCGGILTQRLANVTVRRNIVFGTFSTGTSDCIRHRAEGMVSHNIVYDCPDAGIELQDPQGDGRPRRAENNTIYNVPGPCLQISGKNSSQKNNICWASGSGNDASDPLFVDAAAGNFALQAGSPAIDSGTNCSFTFNGASCDRGAHETITLASCSVEEGDASTLRLLFKNNLFPPIAGVATSGFTYRINGGRSTTFTNAAQQGTNGIWLTLQDPVTTGQAIDFSYSVASGTVSDSALLGGTNNQRLNGITNQACTNNITGEGSPAPPSGVSVAY